MTMIPEAIVGQQVQLLSAAVLATAPLAWGLGRAPERALACAMATLLVLDLLRRAYWAEWTDTAEFRPDLALLDVLLLAWVSAVALRANRLYPLVMAGAALVSVLTHLLRWLELFEGRFSYYALITVPAFVMIGIFWIGLALHVWRERHSGRYPNWRDETVPQSFAATTKLG